MPCKVLRGRVAVDVTVTPGSDISAGMGLLDQLWERYSEHVPYARTFVELAAGDFRNDHVVVSDRSRGGAGSPPSPLSSSGTLGAPGRLRLSRAHLTPLPGQGRRAAVFISQLRAETSRPALAASWGSFRRPAS